MRCTTLQNFLGLVGCLENAYSSDPVITANLKNLLSSLPNEFANGFALDNVWIVSYILFKLCI